MEERYGQDISPLGPLPAPPTLIAGPVSAVRESAGLTWSVPITLGELYERMSLLMELEIPCLIYADHFSSEPFAIRIVRKTNRTPTGFQIQGKGFSHELDKDSLDAIWLVYKPGARFNFNRLAVEIYDRAGNPSMQIFGMPDGVGAAVWQDVMGNPSLSVA